MLRTVPSLDPTRFRSHVCHLTPFNDFAAECEEAAIEPICLGHRRPWHGLRTLVRLLGLLRRLEIDLVHTHHDLDRLYAGLAARLAGRPVVTTLHNTTPPQRPTRGVLGPLGISSTGSVGDRWLRRCADRYVAVSQAVLEAQIRYRRVPRERAEVIHTGVDVEALARPIPQEDLATLRDELGIPPIGPVLLNVGRLHEQKGQEHLIPAFAAARSRIPEASLLIAGEGGERRRLEAAIRQAGLEGSVRLLGLRDDIPALLQLCDIFVFPSVHKEGLPVAVLEAMAAARPVVAARTGPLEELVEHGENGLLVRPADPEPLAAALLELLQDPQRAAAMGRRGREIAKERFSLAAAAASLESLYVELAEREGGSNP